MKIFEVFTELRLDARLRSEFEACEVAKITASQSQNAVYIMLQSDKQLRPSLVEALRMELHRQYFFDSGKKTYIKMWYPGYEEMPTEQLWKQFAVLVEEQIAVHNHLEATLFSGCRKEVSAQGITLSFADSSIARTEAPKIADAIRVILQEWTGRVLAVECIYEEQILEKDTAAEPVYELTAILAMAEKSKRRQETEKSGGVPLDLARGKKIEDAKEHPAPAAPKKPASEARDKRYRKPALPKDPDTIYGKEFDGDLVSICDIQDEVGEVVIRGQIIKYEDRELRSGKVLIMAGITDFTDTIMFKLFLSKEDADALKPSIGQGAFVMLKGIAMYDKYEHEVNIGSISGIKKIKDFRVKRVDTMDVKRVELHCHTQMSDMDAVVNTGELVNLAFSWGHPAIAITDHGVVQSFVDAAHAINPKKFGDNEELKKRYKDFKIIYGMEGYLVDDEGERKPDGTPYDLEADKDAIKKLPSYHVILLCTNDIGRINLYKLTSISHIDYFHRRPKIPKSLLRQNREGLIVGSACEAGELFRAILNEKPEEEVKRISDFYDYYEVQPTGNNAFLIQSESYPKITTNDDLIELNKKIIRLAEEHGKLCIATGDVHFLNPEDELYRRIIMAGKGFADADSQPPLYFRTTEEMLAEFSYLSREKAMELVVTNPNKICDQIEKIQPVRPDKCPPVIENSENELRDICYTTAHSWYGENLPVQVKERLEKELHSIIGNGFAVMYIIAERLVKHSNEDGYLVGSRGSVGSSFVATMSGITEVNPLAPHYYCKHCHFYDFDSELVQEYSQMSGFDMPDRVCPNCGEPLTKDGQNIPFETFLGFNGDKEPDIDLNFSGEYQSKAHAYTEVLFGKGHTFRAGTIGTLADKTAFGFIKKYYEEHGIHKRTAEIERIVQGCVGVRRTTGQHPGGIVVLPHGEEIYSFTAVQRPANDMTTTTVTTHFDYHSIDHNLLKLDILGHDDPTMIRMLEDITGIDAKTIPMDNKDVVSLFESTEALKIKPEDIDGCDLGSLGLPELGTDFVMQMLRDTKPKSFSDMIRISGLSHGTDVWLNNTQTLIKEEKCTLSTAICTRDDIMVYLIHMGVENGKAFKIMESVRKGKGLTEEMEALMIENNVPDWYIWSCKRIKYMFPKAHACAYVMMAFRIAYFKVYYPLAYYAAYFSIRAKAFSYELMALGKEKMLRYMDEYKKRDDLSNKEQDQLKDMKIVQEMYARGFTFWKIDLFKADALRFQVLDGKLMPSLISIDGLGETAALSIAQGVKGGAFLSKEDFMVRCKVGKSTVALLDSLDLFGDLPESNQLSLLDFLGAES